MDALNAGRLAAGGGVNVPDEIPSAGNDGLDNPEYRCQAR